MSASSFAAVLGYPPSANTYWRVWRGRAVKSAEARAYQLAVGRICRSGAARALVGHVQVSVKVYRPAKRGDLDNCLKVLLDALKGHAYADDKQIRRILAEQYEDPANPRAEVTVSPLEAASGEHPTLEPTLEQADGRETIRLEKSRIIAAAKAAKP